MPPPFLVDQHLHSRHSMDSETPPEDNVRRAIEIGLAGLTFTEHFDTHPEEWPQCRYDDTAYTATIEVLRDRYGTEIQIGKGIEVCYQPERMDHIIEFLDRHRFDLVLLSVHWSCGRAFHRREHWGDLSLHEAAGIYLEGVLQAARQAADLRRLRRKPVFNVLGHLDLIKRYGHRFFGEADGLAGHEEQVERILVSCLEAELVPEINTSTLRQGLKDPMPGWAVIQRYAGLGGTAVSLGSDAHTAAAIGADFDSVVHRLPSLGIRQLAVFSKREQSDRVIPDLLF